MESNHRSTRRSIVLPTLLACSSAIGEDLLTEILKRLPTKTLCRFLCVCKSWKTLISSPLFVQTYNSFTSAAAAATPPNLKPHLQAYDRNDSYYLCYPQQLPSTNGPITRSKAKAKTANLGRKIHFPFAAKFEAKDDSFAFVDAIHGVMCISYSSDSLFDSTILWNPAIHRFVTLPCIPFPVDLSKAEDAYVDFYEQADMDKMYVEDGYEPSRHDYEAYVEALGWGSVRDEFLKEAKFKSSVIGFGYDTSNNDFKVVWIWIPNQAIEFDCKYLLPTYEIYSYQAGIWRVESAENLKSCRFYDKVSKAGCFVNGTINWIISAPNQGRSAVLMFDCESEEFSIVDLPVDVWYPQEKAELMDYAGLLTLVLKSTRDYNCPTYVEFWVMEEHGDASSWINLYKFQDTKMGLRLLNLCEDKYMELVPYGPKPRTEKGYNTYGSYDEILSGHVYEESLFLMDDAKAESYMEEDE